MQTLEKYAFPEIGDLPVSELTDHLGYDKHAPDGRNHGKSRNGKTTKPLHTAQALTLNRIL